MTTVPRSLRPATARGDPEADRRPVRIGVAVRCEADPEGSRMAPGNPVRVPSQRSDVGDAGALPGEASCLLGAGFHSTSGQPRSG